MQNFISWDKQCCAAYNCASGAISKIKIFFKNLNKIDGMYIYILRRNVDELPNLEVNIHLRREERGKKSRDKACGEILF